MDKKLILSEKLIPIVTSNDCNTISCLTETLWSYILFLIKLVLILSGINYRTNSVPCVYYIWQHTLHIQLSWIFLCLLKTRHLKKLTCPEIVTRLNTLAVNIQLYLQIVCWTKHVTTDLTLESIPHSQM